MRTLSILTVLATGILTLIFYTTINYIVFEDFGFVPAGRIVFTSNFGYLDYLILPLGLCLGTVILIRKQKTISFKSLFLFGLKTTLLAAILFGTFIFVYLQFIDPDYFQKLIDLIKQLEASKAELTPLKKEMLIRVKTIEETEIFRNPYFYGIANFFAYLIIGSIGTLLFASFLRRKPYVG